MRIGLFEDVTIAEVAVLFFTVACVITTMYLYITGREVPDALLGLMTASLGYWTGMGVSYLRMRLRYKCKCQ